MTWNRQRVRGLRLFEPGDVVLLEAVARGKFAINGLRNRDLANLLFARPPPNQTERRRRSAWVSPRLRMLHGLLQKLPHTHRYQVSEAGRKGITALLAAQHAIPSRLIERAA